MAEFQWFRLRSVSLVTSQLEPSHLGYSNVVASSRRLRWPGHNWHRGRFRTLCARWQWVRTLARVLQLHWRASQGVWNFLRGHAARSSWKKTNWRINRGNNKWLNSARLHRVKRWFNQNPKVPDKENLTTQSWPLPHVMVVKPGTEVKDDDFFNCSWSSFLG